MFSATLYSADDSIKHQSFSTRLQNVVDDMENYCHLSPQEGKVLGMVRLLHCAAGKIVIIEQYHEKE
jgi:hypothetical protein